MRRALYPGTFDPPTLGHLDLIRRGARLFDHLTVGVADNPAKRPLFTARERVNMIRRHVLEVGRVDVVSFRGLVVEFGAAGGFTPDLKALKAEIPAIPSQKSTVKWLPVFAEPNGTVDLKAAFPTTTGGIYVRTFVYSEKAQTATATIHSESPLRIWINDKPSFDRLTADSTEATFSTPLKAGWNSVLMKVAPGTKGQRLGLRFAGTDLRTAGLPETAPAAASGGQ